MPPPFTDNLQRIMSTFCQSDEDWLSAKLVQERTEIELGHLTQLLRRLVIEEWLFKTDGDHSKARSAALYRVTERGEREYRDLARKRSAK